MSDTRASASPVPVQWYKVADLDDLQDGRVRTVTTGTRSLALTRVGDRYGALDNRCPHQGGPLGVIGFGLRREGTAALRAVYFHRNTHGLDASLRFVRSWMSQIRTSCAGDATRRLTFGAHQPGSARLRDRHETTSRQLVLPPRRFTL
jgi:hypothetical protein